MKILSALAMALVCAAGKCRNWAQRVSLQVAFGCVLIVGSHWWADEGERAWLRESGGAVVGISLVRWWGAQHGQRRMNPKTGKELRRPTLRISSEDVDRFWKKNQED